MLLWCLSNKQKLLAAFYEDQSRKNCKLHILWYRNRTRLLSILLLAIECSNLPKQWKQTRHLTYLVMLHPYEPVFVYLLITHSPPKRKMHLAERIRNALRFPPLTINLKWLFADCLSTNQWRNFTNIFEDKKAAVQKCLECNRHQFQMFVQRKKK